MAALRPPDWQHQRRRSVPYFPNAPERPDADLAAYMFVEDISLGILPNELEVRLVPDDQAPARIARIFPTRDEAFRASLRERVRDFIEEAARTLADEGEVWYEVVRPPAGTPGAPPPFVLAQLPPGTITPLPWWVIQHVPGPSRRRLGRRYVAIPRRDTWHLRLPSELGTPREHRSLLRLLGKDRFPPALSLEAMRPGGKSTGYDFAVHRKAHQSMIALATRQWGWTARGDWAEESSAFFLDYRTLRFRRSQVLLREHIIKEVDALLQREGLRTRIVLEGLATAEMVEAMLTRFHDGTAAATDALDLLRK